jgi:hypothetical protein
MTMKKIAICVLMLLPVIGFSQKKANGTIYIEHPAINVVDAFTKAMVKGDTTAMSKMMADNFRSFNPVTASQYSKGQDKASFLGMVKWMQSNLDYYSIERMKGSYPDAFEYSKDPSDDNAVTVESWDILKGVHKKTGVKADMLLHRSIVLTKNNKIRSVGQYMNPEFGDELGRASSERKNGTIYSQHENINKLRLMLAAAENGDIEKYYTFYAEKARFRDINTEKSKTLKEDMASKTAFLENFELVGFEQVGYPDYMHYEMGDAGTLYSWWNLHVIRKSDDKAIEVPIHYSHTVNKEGKFTSVSAYYNGSLFE